VVDHRPLEEIVVVVAVVDMIVGDDPDQEIFDHDPVDQGPVPDLVE